MSCIVLPIALLCEFFTVVHHSSFGDDNQHRHDRVLWYDVIMSSLNTFLYTNLLPHGHSHYALSMIVSSLISLVLNWIVSLVLCRQYQGRISLLGLLRGLELMSYPLEQITDLHSILSLILSDTLVSLSLTLWSVERDRLGRLAWDKT